MNSISLIVCHALTPFSFPITRGASGHYAGGGGTTYIDMKTNRNIKNNFLSGFGKRGKKEVENKDF